MEGVRKALQKHKNYLMSLDNVVGVGIGFKVTGGKETGTPAVIVFVSQKMPQTMLRGEAVIPQKLDKVSTDVMETGEISFYGRTERLRPAQPGSSISHYRITAGTFGAVVKDAQSGEPLILSNCHVLANASNGRDGRAQPGDPILQPGAYDGGTEEDIIGHLERYVPIRRLFEETDCPLALTAAAVGDRVIKLVRPNYRMRLEKSFDVDNIVDCAVARPVSDDAVAGEIMELGEVAGTAAAQPGMPVQKSGRTSGLTSGTVTAVDVTLRVQLGEGSFAVFSDQMVSNMLSRPGDSGSLVLNEEMQAVGLLFAGSDHITVFNKIANVMEALAIEF